MGSTNQGPEYFTAEKQYLNSKSIDEKIYWLEEMLRSMKKHKGTENMERELKTRLKKLKSKLSTSKKSGSSKKGIKKEGFQFALMGPPNAGKSSLLAKLTNAKPQISPHPFSTQAPIIGTLDHEGIKAQVIDLPSIGSPNLDHSILHSADCLLIVITNLSELENITINSQAKKIILLNKSDLLSQNQLRKLEQTYKSKKIPGLIISTKSDHNIPELKELMFQQMNIIRVYTKQPHKEKTKEPIVLPQKSTVKDAAEKILKGFSAKIKETRLTGPSSKFPNQKVGLSHVLKDKDIIEFHTK